MSQKKWIILFAVVIAVMAGLWFFLTRADGHRTVVITSEGKEIRRIDLSAAQDETFEVINSAGARNTVCIEAGVIWVKDADCPDGICVSHGPLKEGGTPIVCLPHRLVIRWADAGGEVDN